MAIETVRLTLCRPTLADMPALFEFLGDSTAMQHTRVHTSIRDCRRRVAAHERRRRQDGYAPWTVVNKADGRIVGPATRKRLAMGVTLKLVCRGRPSEFDHASDQRLLIPTSRRPRCRG
jgi:hypothetical protein